MAVAILALTLVACLVLDAVTEYDEATDENPGSLWHKMIRRLSRWISGDPTEAENPR